jgi:DNA-directed RNA polymerase
MSKEQSEYVKHLTNTVNQHSLGIARYNRAKEKAADKGRETAQGAGVSMLATLAPPMVEAIKHRCDGRRKYHGPPPIWLPNLKLVDPWIAAKITLTALIDGSTKSKLVTRTAEAIGARIEDQLKFAYYKRSDISSFNHAKGYAADAVNYKRQHKIYSAFMNRNEEIKPWTDWTPTECKQLGGALMNFATLTGAFIKIQAPTSKKKGKTARPPWLMELSPLFLEQWEKKHGQLAERSPYYQPLLHPPIPWTAHHGGGYEATDHHEDGIVRDIALVKIRRGFQQGDPNINPDHRVLTALNALQDTAYVVNELVLKTVEEMRDRNMEMKKIPTREKPPEPDKPSWLVKGLKYEDMTLVQQDAFKAWKTEQKDWEVKVIQWESKTRTINHIIDTAYDYLDKGPHWHPMSCDYRGRVYTLATGYSPLGPDLARGLQKFAVGKPIGTEEGSEFFCQVGATHYGYDKTSLADRIDWVVEHEDEILAVAESPVENWEHWQDAEEPWAYLAWCFEYAEWEATGFDLNYVSHKVCAADASQNGVQHYSAMLRDVEAATAVNLLPTDVPQDIYQQGADALIEVLEAIVNSPESEPLDEKCAKEWLKSPFLTRKLTKRPIMTRIYSSCLYGQNKMIHAFLKEQEEAGETLPFESVKDAVNFITPLGFKAIGDLLSGASEAMGWLKDLAAVTAGLNQPLRWTTPSGFVVKQAYQVTKPDRVYTIIGNPMRMSTKEPTDKIHKAETKNGISANFIHSRDAAHMVLTVAAMAKQMPKGSLSFTSCHDSFGTHACDAPLLAKTLREEFCKMYQYGYALKDLQREVTARLKLSGFDLKDEWRKHLETVERARLKRVSPKMKLIDRVEQASKNVAALGENYAEPPLQGDLDLSLVEASDFFFS